MAKKKKGKLRKFVADVRAERKKQRREDRARRDLLWVQAKFGVLRVRRNLKYRRRLKKILGMKVELPEELERLRRKLIYKRRILGKALTLEEVKEARKLLNALKVMEEHSLKEMNKSRQLLEKLEESERVLDELGAEPQKKLPKLKAAIQKDIRINAMSMKKVSQEMAAVEGFLAQLS